MMKYATQNLFTGKTLSNFSASTLSSHLQTLFGELSQHSYGTYDAVNMTTRMWAFVNDVLLSYIVNEDFGFQRQPDLQTFHNNTRIFNAIDVASVLRAFPLANMALELWPLLRKVSPVAWLDKVRVLEGVMLPQY